MKHLLGFLQGIGVCFVVCYALGYGEDRGAAKEHKELEEKLKFISSVESSKN